MLQKSTNLVTYVNTRAVFSKRVEARSDTQLRLKSWKEAC